MIKWENTKIEEYKLAKKIADRTAKELGQNVDKQSIQMDIIATHISGCKLKLAELLKAKTFDFLHDVLGINKHLNRTTGKLQNCFSPRYSAS